MLSDHRLRRGAIDLLTGLLNSRQACPILLFRTIRPVWDGFCLVTGVVGKPRPVQPRSNISIAAVIFPESLLYNIPGDANETPARTAHINPN